MSHGRRAEQIDRLLDWPRLKIGKPVAVAMAAKFLGVSKNTARSYLQELVADGGLVAENRGQTIDYRLAEPPPAAAQAVSSL